MTAPATWFNPLLTVLLLLVVVLVVGLLGGIPYVQKRADVRSRRRESLRQLRWASELLHSDDRGTRGLGAAQLGVLRRFLGQLDKETSDLLKASLDASVNSILSTDYHATEWHRLLQQSLNDPQRKVLTTKPAQSEDDVAYGIAAWRLLGSALGKAGIGTVYVAGEPDPQAINKLENAITKLAEDRRAEVEWGPVQRGSWWRRFLVLADSDTSPAADRDTWPATEVYARSIASLANAARELDHAYFVAADVALIKSRRDGESFVVSRVLTSAEMQRYRDGELEEILADPARALEFLDPSARRSVGTSSPAPDSIEGTDGGTHNEVR